MVRVCFWLLAATLMTVGCTEKAEEPNPKGSPVTETTDDGGGDGAGSDDGGGDGGTDDGTDDGSTGTTEAVDADNDGFNADVDCDDNDRNINPGEDELCDGFDNDCDGLIDDQDDNVDPESQAEFHADIDGDGFGDPENTVLACRPSATALTDATDCDDTNADVNPAASEVCNDIDDDCDLLVDDADPNLDTTTRSTFFADTDGDGFGVPGSTRAACTVSTGWSTSSDDCDDTNPAVHPAATEICNSLDDNCDGLVDDDDPALDTSTTAAFYADVDSDGFGDPAAPSATCVATAGTVANSDDCDDTNAAVNPSSTEVCDGIDNDCNAATDDADPALDLSTVTVFYADTDGDGYGDPSSTFGYCTPPTGWTSDATDCDDSDLAVHPGATEVCDTTDNDCDGLVDDQDPGLDTSTASTFYPDADADTYGDGTLPTLACVAPTDYVTDATDCDDADATIRPGGTEVCDGYDNDCDGLFDGDDPSVDASTSATYYLDADSDGFGLDDQTTESCSRPSGYAILPGDCDDTDPNFHPSADEICDALDNDCDGLTDDDDTDVTGLGATAWYQDADGDGYGDASTEISTCVAPGGAYVTNGDDCDDTATAIHPMATEICDAIDNDCNGLADDNDPSLDTSTATPFFTDNDGDTYGDGLVLACIQPTGTATRAGDCNDSAPGINPFALEVCDGTDNDCDGLTDDDDTDTATAGMGLYFYDVDLDGYGDSATEVMACVQPAGTVSLAGDCDDTSSAVYPGATEVCDGVDNDCNALADDDDSGLDTTTATTAYADADGDGFGDPATSGAFCAVPSDYVADNTDCDDTEATAYPGGTERCDGVDNDCDTLVDSLDPDVSPSDTATWYADTDSDGYGDASTTVEACDQPTGYVYNADDCDDTAASISPDADEACDGIDNDCDGLTDDDDDVTDPTSALVIFDDVDGDGWGDDATLAYICTPDPTAITTGGDCDDTDYDINPDALEACDEVDNDCDGLVDDADPMDLDFTSASLWYNDSDSDGFGASSGSIYGCDLTSMGRVDNGDDCDDTDDTINPLAVEVCDSIDNDCDGDTDDTDADLDTSSATTWYADNDRDRYGSTTITTVACTAPPSFISTGGDCDDSNPSVNPAATEVCDALYTDENCNGFVDGNDATLDTSTASIVYRDDDGDGYGDGSRFLYSCHPGSSAVLVAGDCDDNDIDVSPAADEVCDGIDNDCDGDIDDADSSLDVATASTWYVDADGDGFGVAGSTATACDLSASGYSEVDTDCDDGDDGIFPDAPEVCDGIDNNCNLLTDDSDPTLDPTTTTAYYVDSDGDGYGDPASLTLSCVGISGTVTVGDDCDDTDSAVFPAATEVCDGVDNDCNALLDDADPGVDPSTQATYYADLDGDGFGDAAASTLACTIVAGLSTDNTDCDDLSADVYPTASEVCDGLDNDCDTLVDAADPDVPPSTVVDWFQDGDGDGYGNASSVTSACNQPSGYVLSDTDCNDADAAIHPAASEVCDSQDNDCDGLTDDDDTSLDPATTTTYYADSDSDGYGDPTATGLYCTAPSGFVANSDDCDDSAAAIHPGATEVCDSVDNDCDALTDDDDPSVDSTTQTLYYTDVDRDGFGDAASPERACALTAGLSSLDTDCNDRAAAIYPGAGESCDTVDNDCDGLIDADDPDLDPALIVPWYADTDGDGFGTPSTSVSDCLAPTGYVASSTDCDDSDATIHPSASEVCDGIDNDCDALTDDDDTSVDPLTQTVWYPDADSDGYGDATSPQRYCTAPSGVVSDGTDCDDTRSSVNPGGSEVCDGLDNDCDTKIDDDDPTIDTSTQSIFYVDADRDGYGDAANPQLACSAIAGLSSDDTDCDDSNSGVNPAAPEACDTLDNDCDGLVDAADPDLDPALISDWFQDADGDGFGNAAVSQADCLPPTGYVAMDTDCDDTSAAINPNAAEVCDSIDNDCDTLVDDDDTDVDPTTQTIWFADDDSDGYGDPLSATPYCVAPSGVVSDNSDCNDTDADIHPGSVEVCDGADNDCNTLRDDDDPGLDLTTRTTFYTDNDRDTYGDPASSTDACFAYPGLTTDNTDCDDTAFSIHPGAGEACDGIDNDCDSLVDADDSDLDPSTISSWYADTDGDLYGDAAVSTLDCRAPTGYVGNDGDCDDSDASIHPSADEICDSIDNDCDSLVDDDDTTVLPTSLTAYYTDADGDTYGDTASRVDRCVQPAGTILVGGDCDDTNIAINPAATEECDGIDNDCDTDVDDDDANLDVTTTLDWYPDADADGYGDQAGTATAACDLSGSGYSLDNTDCDDATDTVSPGSTEVCDGVDNDCDALVDAADSSVDTSTYATFYADTDGDGYGDAGTSSYTCTAPTGYVSTNTDCDDTDSAVHPGATEICDALSTDEDCDGLVEDADPSLDRSTMMRVYRDSDGDGYGTGAALQFCALQSGYAAVNGDCSDSNAAANPGATEVCDLVDNDCDGKIDMADTSLDVSTMSTWYRDADNDTYGDSATSVVSCGGVGYTADSTDCDDSNRNIHPGAAEICDSKDNDCDGLTDDADTDVSPTSGTRLYADTDGDNYGDSTVSAIYCTAPTGWILNSSDCDDNDATINPGAAEVCDLVDNDCDSRIDEADPSLSRSLLARFYNDADGDGYGDSAFPIDACFLPAGAASASTDCDDMDDTVYPGAREVCNIVDDDCDGAIDESLLDNNLDGTTPSVLSFNGVASHSFYSTDGYAHLTSNTAYEAGTVFLTEQVDAAEFYASFEMYLGDNSAGGDGVAFFFVEDTDYTWVNGYGDSFGGDGLTGYAVVFDTYQNVGDPTSASGNFVGLYELDPSAGYTLLDSDVTISNLEDNNTHTVSVLVIEGDVEVTVDGVLVLSTAISGYTMTDAMLGWGGGTGGAANYQNIDDPYVGCEPAP